MIAHILYSSFINSIEFRIGKFFSFASLEAISISKFVHGLIFSWASKLNFGEQVLYFLINPVFVTYLLQ